MATMGKHVQPFLVRVLCLIAFSAVIAAEISISQQVSGQEDSLWFWDGKCANGENIGIQVLVDGQMVYRSRFRACHVKRTETLTKSENEAQVFEFSGGHTFQNEFHTSKKEKIEGNIWQAGADPDDILLGVSFGAPHQILLNTIHIVEPHKPTQSTLDRNAIIKTFPIRASEKRSWAESAN
jgi:hypothetical protein